MNRFRLTLSALLCAPVLIAAPPPASAEPVEDVVRITLEPGWRTETGSHMAGLRIVLAPGWKTYWRVPGESGIPPEFGFEGSRNVASVSVFWPRPSVFESYGLETIGYSTQVVLPVELEPRDGGEAMGLSGRASIGVCKDICLPVDVRFSTEIAPGAGLPVPEIAQALATVPGAVRGLDVARCTVEPIRDGLRVTATIAVPPQGGTERVFLEPGRVDVWASPSEVTRRGDTITAVTELVPPEAQPFALDRGALRFTVLGADGAVEMRGCQAD
ncbi:hypothetical protein DKT77_16585 [Meridianimarinicoccus roseus]|uniref:Thiol:disulfide interchange protein DsbD N-terminal domain-containing protein n=1 Tax=Meridianimarinicoccus roseus TaxID=2072018 RepID=A0A2V2LH78_9RHOB|nr:protein-disulfide reductase DsbD domain-containing protein [Meridianimarinicoccus roseus]PWR01729.1 hypothetical protein DKT77_16585 [Meridianimarinicoccus roseus]